MHADYSAEADELRGLAVLGADSSASGGGHGGRGGSPVSHSFLSAGCFGSTLLPRTSGGAGILTTPVVYPRGGEGGGRIEARIRYRLRVDGLLSCNGGMGINMKSAGAGGSLLLLAKYVDGDGILQVNGGKC